MMGFMWLILLMKQVTLNPLPKMWLEFIKKWLEKTWIWVFQKKQQKLNNLIIIFIHLESRIVLIGINSSLMKYPMIPITKNPIAHDLVIWMYSFLFGFSHLLKNFTQSSKNSRSSFTLASTTFVIYNYNTNYFDNLMKLSQINPKCLLVPKLNLLRYLLSSSFRMEIKSDYQLMKYYPINKY